MNIFVFLICLVCAIVLENNYVKYEFSFINNQYEKNAICINELAYTKGETNLIILDSNRRSIPCETRLLTKLQLQELK